MKLNTIFYFAVKSTPNSFSPVQGQLIETLPKFGKQFSVSFSFQLEAVVPEQMFNLVHFTTGEDSEKYGDRAPAVFVEKGRVVQGLTLSYWI